MVLLPCSTMLLYLLLYSYGLCCKLGTEFAKYYEAVEQHEADKDRCVSCDYIT